jgi:hypothetical protein
VKKVVAALLIACAGLNVQAITERPIVNLPVDCRQGNWTSDGSGSCVHATMISLFRWQGRFRTAEHWRGTYGSGEGPGGLAAKFDREGVRYAYVTDGDERFLEWACRTRRGCASLALGQPTA